MDACDNRSNQINKSITAESVLPHSSYSEFLLVVLQEAESHFEWLCKALEATWWHQSQSCTKLYYEHRMHHSRLIFEFELGIHCVSLFFLQLLLSKQHHACPHIYWSPASKRCIIFGVAWHAPALFLLNSVMKRIFSFHRFQERLQGRFHGHKWKCLDPVLRILSRRPRQIVTAISWPKWLNSQQFLAKMVELTAYDTRVRNKVVATTSTKRAGIRRRYCMWLRPCQFSVAWTSLDPSGKFSLTELYWTTSPLTWCYHSMNVALM